MKSILFIPLFLLALQACGPEQHSSQLAKVEIQTPDRTEQVAERNRIEPAGKTIETRFFPPMGFERTTAQAHSFAAYLRQLPLKPHGTEVRLHNKEVKPDYGVYDAVVDLEIGTKDLHQCADAVMRLRAEYLWNQERYDQIHFNFTNGFRVDYTEWMQGKRMIVKGNSTYWSDAGTPSNTYTDFWNYMELIFTYAGTLSLSKELEPASLADLQIGDVFIQGGSPGHAVMVVDVAINPKSKKKVFLLAQSYMPAQEIQILKNPNDEGISPWYSADIDYQLDTPEWTFNTTDLKRFEE